MKDKWLTSYQAAHELALRDSPTPLAHDAPKDEKLRDRRVMDAFYKRVERGTVPRPVARLANGDLRFSEKEIVEFKTQLEREERERRGRKRGGASDAA